MQTRKLGKRNLEASANDLGEIRSVMEKITVVGNRY